jgi:proteasome assembly chaperone 4
MTNGVSIYTKYVAPSKPGGRGLAVQVIELVDSYMIWVGEVEGGPEEVGKAMVGGRLCRDWACGLPGIGTRLAGGGESIAIGMAQRLASRFGKMVYVSVDVGVGGDGEVELGIVGVIGG